MELKSASKDHIRYHSIIEIIIIKTISTNSNTFPYTQGTLKYIICVTGKYLEFFSAFDQLYVFDIPMLVTLSSVKCLQIF